MRLVPTTAGTGSETTGTAILDIPSRNFKTGIANRALKPMLVRFKCDRELGGADDALGYCRYSQYGFVPYCCAHCFWIGRCKLELKI